MLWPADLTDLDRLKAQRNDPDFYRLAAVDGMTLEESGKLLDDLVDLDYALQSYASGVLGARAVTTRIAGRRILKLIRAEEDRSIISDNLQKSLDVLSTLIAQYQDRLLKVAQREDRCNNAIEQWKAHEQKITAASKRVDAQTQNINTMVHNLNKTKDQLTKGLQALHSDRAVLQRDQAQVNKEREEAQRDRVEVRQTIAQKETDVRIQIGMMKDQVDEAEAKACQAQKERDETKDQNNKLADQLRELQRKIKEEQIARSNDKAKRKKVEEQMAAIQATNQRLRARIRSGSATTNGAMPDIPTSSQQQSLSSPETSGVSLGLSPSDSKRFHNDSSLSILPPRRHVKRAASDIDDSDDEGFPMPGLPPSKYKRSSAAASTRMVNSPSQLSKPILSSSSPAMVDLTNAQVPSSSRVSIDLTGSTSSSSTDSDKASEKPRTYASGALATSHKAALLSQEHLMRGWGVATGKKRKIRA